MLAARRALAAAARRGCGEVGGAARSALPSSAACTPLPPHVAPQQLWSAAARRCSGAAAGGVPVPPPGGVAHWAAVYGQLSKFKLSAFVVSTSCAGYALGSGDTLDWIGMAWTAVGTWGAAACANTLNQVAERRNDGLMKRTHRRPLPSGAMSPQHALVFAAVTGVTGVALLYYQANPTTAALGAANIVLYAAVYTPLKQISVYNTWVGAVVGAIPPLMGWAAAAGGLEPGAGVLAGLLYFWQLPHFMALAYLYRTDYAAGGYRMLPIIDATGRRTAAVALRNSLYMVPLGFAACALGVTTPPFAWEAAALSSCLAAGAAAFYSAPTQASARRLFLLSLGHLPALQLACVTHRVPNTAAARAEAPATMAQWSARHRALLAADSSPPRQDVIRTALLTGSSVAPFPLLPMPRHVTLQCPSRAACQEQETAPRAPDAERPLRSQ